MNIAGQYIKAKRQELGMGQVDLSEALKAEHRIQLDQSDISEIERGVRGIKDVELVAIASVLSVSPNQLLGWK